MKPDLLSPLWAHGARPVRLAPREWETLLSQSRRTALAARLSARVAQAGWRAAVPGPVRVHLDNAARLAERQGHEVRWEVDALARALAPLGAPVVLLKGAAYLMTGLPAARGRLFADIDILVPGERLADAEALLFGAGWISDERDAYNQRYYRQWMHEVPPLRHVQRNTFVDLHHSITAPTSRYRVDSAELLRDLTPVPGYPGLFVLAPPLLVLHSAVHLFQEGEFHHGLRDLLDMDDLIRLFEREAGFWPALIERAAALGLGVPLHHALFHRERLFGRAVPAPWRGAAQALRAGVLSRRFMAWALGRALVPPQPPGDGALTGLARWLLYVRSHALRMPPQLLLPHLLRKAWMRRSDASAVKAMPTAQTPSQGRRAQEA